jgi:hypothetical protein
MVRLIPLCPLVALLGHPTCTEECPLSGVKRTWLGLVSMSANDPQRTFTRGIGVPRRLARATRREW